MRPRHLAALCVLALVLAFTIDLFTPQLLVAAILLDVPIVLSTFAGSPRLTGSLVIAALVANALAGYVNGVQAGGAWDAIGLGDRGFAALSIVLVGWLGLAIHQGAERSGVASALAEEARRERALWEASQNIRNSLSEELVERAIVRHARRLLGARRASFFVFGAAAGRSTRYDAVPDSPDVIETAERPQAEIQSILTRALETQQPLSVSRQDSPGRLALGTLGAEAALVAPVIDGGTRYGVLLLCLTRSAAPEDLRRLRSFAETAALALAQARVFRELAEKNEQLAQRSDLIRDIVYALSHDLRTPLAAAGLTLRQARQGAYGPMPHPYLEILDRSIAANDELQRLAETLLLVAQYESGERTAIHRPVDVARCLREVAEQLEPLAKSKGLQVSIDAPERALVSGDAGELRRSLVNLFANAVTWSRNGGTIRIALTRAGRDFRVEIADEGFGVPAEIRETLFMRFAGERKLGGGTGLGLYIVRRIAEEHGGRVRYAPNPPEGSVFTLELPALAEAEVSS